jgi:hypothetical protein
MPYFQIIWTFQETGQSTDFVIMGTVQQMSLNENFSALKQLKRCNWKPIVKKIEIIFLKSLKLLDLGRKTI